MIKSDLFDIYLLCIGNESPEGVHHFNNYCSDLIKPLNCTFYKNICSWKCNLMLKNGNIDLFLESNEKIY